jgi:predicted negative regulator of RcsB-dependent stress response
MELQDAPATYLFKIWPWIETNKVRIASGAGALLVATGLIYFYSWQRDQKEVNAGNDLTQLMISDQHSSTPVQQAGLYLKIARANQNTSAGQRAFLQSATMLFEAGQYAEAQTQFEQFLSQYPDSFFAGQAALGAATSLDAQGKMDLAAAAYQRVISAYPDPLVANYAKYSLAQIDERQGKPAEALKLYQDVASSSHNSSLGSEAGIRTMELKMKQPAPAAPVTAPFKLNP